ncbi:MAG: hypothetical protein IPM24_14245 [Bryobacterales bacterium]|nr:hypothetical protein [Bryobacterales bacterium]
MHVRLCAFVAVLSVCFSFPLAAANPWRKLTSTHFELYSSVGDRRARAALQTLEQTMEVFAQFTRSRPVLDNRVRVVLFRDQREYNQYAPDPQTAAFYTANDLRDFVIMRQLPQDTLEVAVHEFIHLLVKHSRMQFPSWFNEGLAEVYSTYRPEGKDVVIGHVIERHMRHLAGARWLDLDLVLNLDYRVTPFKDPERKAMFYAQSWALCHMLLFDKKYTAKRGALMTQLADGKPAKQVFSELYGASTLDMLDSLRDYLGQRVLMMWKAPIHVDKSRIEAEAVDVEDMEIGLVFAELHGVMARFEQAREVYGKLTPDDWRVQFGLARLARRTGDDTAARGHYERAIALGADDGALFTDYARVLQALGGDPAEVTRSLARAAELRPGDAAIRTWYAFHLVDQNEPFQGAEGTGRHSQGRCRERIPALRGAGHGAPAVATGPARPQRAGPSQEVRAGAARRACTRTHRGLSELGREGRDRGAASGAHAAGARAKARSDTARRRTRARPHCRRTGGGGVSRGLGGVPHPVRREAGRTQGQSARPDRHQSREDRVSLWHPGAAESPVYLFTGP